MTDEQAVEDERPPYPDWNDLTPFERMQISETGILPMAFYQDYGVTTGKRFLRILNGMVRHQTMEDSIAGVANATGLDYDGLMRTVHEALQKGRDA
jgi:hypothetical protein